MVLAAILLSGSLPLVQSGIRGTKIGVSVLSRWWGLKTGMQAVHDILQHHLILISLRHLHDTNIPPLPFAVQATKRPDTDPREQQAARIKYNVGINVTS